MKKETKLAIFAILTIALAIWGYKYLKGFNILSKATTLYAIYDRVDGLRLSNPIYIKGLQVGLVAKIEQEDKDLRHIKVTMELNAKIKVPKNTRAELVTTSLMGGNAVNLVFEGNCEGSDCAQTGDYIEGVTKGMLASFATPDEVKLYMDELNKGLQRLLDTLTNRLSESKDLNNSVQDVRAILTNLRNTTGRLDNVMAASSGAIQGSLKNIESITANLKESNQQIKTILANAETLTTDLNKANISGLAADAQTTIKKLQSTLETSEKAIANLDAVLANLKSGDGAIPMLMNDPKFAENLKLTVNNLDLLLQDVRLHPERYRRILSKKKMPYEKPKDQ